MGIQIICVNGKARGAVVKSVVVLLAVIVCCTACSRVQTRNLARPNPTSYSFPFSSQHVHDAAMVAFSSDCQWKHPVFGRQSSPYRWPIWLESVTNASYSKAIFSDPLNAQDLYLHCGHDPVVPSAVYVGKGGNLPFIADFHLHLQMADSNATVVSVAALNAEVINGEHFGIGSCGPGMANTYVPVKPTTVEEYTILRYLGNYLGVTNMPAVNLPAETK
jgi:hypothetical protein